MEFGLFFNGYLPGPAAHDPDSEHLMLMREAEYAVLGDRHNWKYAWFGEHHGLTEYSHMSAPYPVMGYVAGRTDQIHVGSAITSFPTSKDHPVRIAERAAMMDHLSEGRFEFGTGRGAGSHEVRTFNGTELTETKAMWDEVIREIRACGNRRITSTMARRSRCQRLTTSSRSPTARAIPRCGWRAAIPPPTRRPAPWASGRSPSTSNRSTT